MKIRKYIFVIALAAAGATQPASAADPLDEVRQAIDEYRLDDATDILDRLEANTKRNRKARLTADQQAEVDEMRSSMVTLSNMLERVEQIAVIDSMVVDFDDFFLNYRLSAEAGRITKGTGREGDNADVAFTPEQAREIFWAAADSGGVSRLYSADILDDGTVEAGRVLDIAVGDDADLSYPFLMADGISLYFSADCDQSIGGFDIFMTRRNDDGAYTMPQNVGLPYNSPYNDYMLAIDEATGLGWWATDRNAPEGKVTIYVFVPSASRINYSPDRDDLASLARLDNIAATRPEGADYSELLARLGQLGQASAEGADSGRAQFSIAAGGKVYTRLSQLPNADARRAMTEVISRQRNYDRIDARLTALRGKYRSGDHSVSTEILNLEQQRAREANELARARNEAARAINR